MAQLVSVSLKTVCKDDAIKVHLDAEFGKTADMTTSGVEFTGQKAKTVRLVGQLSASLLQDLETAKANRSNHVKVRTSCSPESLQPPSHHLAFLHLHHRPFLIQSSTLLWRATTASATGATQEAALPPRVLPKI
jgi:hypothetical protein